MNKQQIIPVLLLVICCYCMTYSQTDTLTILHINDSHSCLAPLGPRTAGLEGTQGGIARAASLIGLTKMTDPNVLTLHAGDIFIGDLFFNVYFGAAEFQLLNALGFDAITLGNHEFDLQPSTLAASLSASFPPDSGFSILSANLILPDTSLLTLDSYVSPFTIKDMGSFKVGIFGLTTPETNVLSLPAPAVIDTNIVQCVLSMVDTLSKESCDVIILLSHMGLYFDEMIASNIPGINLIVSGHDHYLLEQPFEVTNPLGKTTWIVQTDGFYKHIGKLQLTVSSGEVNLLGYQAIPLDENIPEEPAVKAQIDGLTAGIEDTYGPVYSQQIGNASAYFEEVAHSLLSNGNHDTPIGNLAADAYRITMGTDIAIQPGGSTAQPLYEGPLVAADAFRTVGYGFNTINGLGYRLVTFDISGFGILTGLEFGLSGIELSDEFFLQVSGMNYVYNPSWDPYSRLYSVEIGGLPIDPMGTYSVTTNELVYLLMVDPSFLGLEVDNVVLHDSTTEFQVLTGYIASLGIINPTVEGRIRADNTVGVEVVHGIIPNEFNLEQNYPNPFNPSTTIKFSLPSAGHVILKVYDAIGQEVEVLLSKEILPGNYKVVWNAAGLPSGVYFYNLRFKNHINTKKMVLIR